MTPPASLLWHTRASPTTASTGTGYLPEYLAYLGWPLIVVLVAAAIRYWRDPRIRIMAVTWAVLEVFSLGGVDRKFLGFRYPGPLLPWHWLQSLPVVGAILPDRFSILADGAAAAVLAFALDLARSAVPEAAGWLRRSLPAAVAVLALAPLIPLPLHAQTVTQVPAGWQAAFARLRLPANAPVLIVPVPYSHRPEPMRWQADTGEPGSFNGGWFVGPDQTGQSVVEHFGLPRITAFFLYLDALWAGRTPWSCPIPLQDPRRPRVPAAGRGRRGHQPRLTARALPVRAPRPTDVRRGRGARVAALAFGPIVSTTMAIRAPGNSAAGVARRWVAERHRGRRLGHPAAVGALTALVAVAYCGFALAQYYTFRTSSFDLVIFDQAVRSYAHFHPGIAPIFNVFEGLGPNFPILGNHFSPIDAALAPLYWIHDGPQTLLVAQAVLFALAIPPLWVFTRRTFGGGPKATVAVYLVSVAYALSWPVASALAFDFHEVAFVPLLTAVALERLQAGLADGPR